MRPKSYQILLRCVQEGTAHGYRRAHKHNDQPPQALVEAEIEQAIMNEITEYFDFTDEDLLT